MRPDEPFPLTGPWARLAQTPPAECAASGRTVNEVVAELLAEALRPEAVPPEPAPVVEEPEGRLIGWCQQCEHLIEFCRCAEGPY